MDYGGINAKVKAMRGNLLKTDDYYNLAGSSDLFELGRKLREYSAYTDLVDKLTASPGYDRHNIEERMTFLTGNDYKRIYSFLSDRRLKDYLKAFILKMEIQLIKFILCALYDEREINTDYEELSLLSTFDYGFDVNALASSKNVREFIDNLKGTAFYDILHDSYSESQSLFDIEMKLDFYYYNNLWKAKKRNLTGSNNKVATLLNGTEIDMQNIAWIYRLKTYYNLPNTLIYQYIIPIKYRIDNESMTRLIEAQTQAQLFNEIKSTTYGYAFTENKGIEKVYYDIMAKVHRRALSDGGDSIAVIMEYLFRKHLETDNIISLVEGVRYHLNPDEIIMFLYLNDADQGGD